MRSSINKTIAHAALCASPWQCNLMPSRGRNRSMHPTCSRAVYAGLTSKAANSFATLRRHAQALKQVVLTLKMRR